MGINPDWPSKEAMRYERAMKLIAIAIEDCEWEKLLGDGLDNTSMRSLVSDINKRTKDTVIQLEKEYLGKDATWKWSGQRKTSIRGLGDSFLAILEKVEVMPRRKSQIEMDSWLAGRLGEVPGAGTQQAMTSFLGA